MKNANDHAPYLFIGGVVAIVVMVVLALNDAGSLEGAAFFREKVTGPADYHCTDDDPGNDFYMAGEVRYGSYIYPDHCEDDDLHQFYCSRNKPTHTRHYPCPNGCKDGACISS